MFAQKGKIILATNQEKSTDDLELTIIDSGADDYQKINNQFIIYTKPNELDKVRIKLEENHINLESLELIFEPTNPQPISEEDKEKLTNFIDELESLEDVSKTYINLG